MEISFCLNRTPPSAIHKFWAVADRNDIVAGTVTTVFYFRGVCLCKVRKKIG